MSVHVDEGLPSPWWEFRPGGEISLFYMNWLVMDYFSPNFLVILT